MSEWKSIESVPKNGMPFLLWVEGFRMIEIMTNWDGSYWRKGEAIPDNDAFTHWMPLPEPPALHAALGGKSHE